MSDTEREAFEAWFGPTFLDTPVWEPVRHGYNNHAVHMAWKGWQARARRSTTTEARAPLSDEQIEEFWCEAGLGGWGIQAEYREAALKFARLIAARAPAPPSDAPTAEHWRVLGRFFRFWAGSHLYEGSGEEVDIEEPYEAFRALAALAGPPALTPLQAVQRPAGGDDVMARSIRQQIEQAHEPQPVMRPTGGDKQ